MMERDPTQCELAAKAGIFYSTLSGRMPGHSQDMDTFGGYAHALAGKGERTANAVNDIFQKLLGGA